jgi:DNA-binding IscR family transcriptional regulator
MIGVSPNAIKQHLSKLQNDKLLKRVGGRKSGYWEVLDKKATKKDTENT